MLTPETIRRAARIQLSRLSFWEYCKTLAPDFYKDDRPHLFKLCDTLQKLYEGSLLLNGTPTKKLMINMPPQHGKSRTLINFSAWVFGKNPDEKIITASYNDLTASDFSRYTRDAISEVKNEPEEIIYSDVFPNTKIKHGNAGHERWALEGQHFSYIGAGVGGSITSKGGTILMIDDPVKGAAEATNENELEKIWLWYTSTFLSRVSAVGGEPLEIVNMTRWSKKDICGRLLDNDPNGEEWYVLKMEAMNPEGEMLCPDLLSKKRYDGLKKVMDDGIFNANYHQQPLDAKGALFTGLNYYKPSELTSDAFEGSMGYCDVADEGSDNLAAIVGRNIKSLIYIPAVVFSKDNTDITMPQVAEMFKKHNVKYARVESNAMGAMFGRALQKLIPSTSIMLIASTTNKHTRIIMEAMFIKKYFVFLHPDYQDDQYKRFMRELGAYLKESKKQQHDDAPDASTGLSMFVRQILNHLYE